MVPHDGWMAGGEYVTPPRVLSVGAVLLALGTGVLIMFLIALRDLQEESPFDSETLVARGHATLRMSVRSVVPLRTRARSAPALRRDRLP
jgi:hypothetical protein